MAKLRRITLVDQVVDELGRLIRETWEGGEELPSISELGDQFGVSRAVVREALKSLEAQGMVEVSNGRRARVSKETARPLLRFFANALDLNSASNGEIVELWRALEGDAAALAASNRTDAELSTLRDIARRAEAGVERQSAFARLDDELHEEILLAAHNRILHDLVHSLRETILEPIVGEDGEHANVDAESIRLNARLVNAISRRDPQAARLFMGQLLRAVPKQRSAPAAKAFPNQTPVPRVTR